ncbi:MFS transporter [Ureibacillus sp. MALMAid1270]|uniref:MFS transporter n=1 Tax=Ureibacillus sp. MALMAid1270 TaxID=3411629 RepID=UPI003BA3FCEE
MNTKGYSIQDKQFWVIVLSLSLASMFIFAAFYSFQPLLPVLTDEFDITVSSASMTMSVSTISLILGLIVLGFLSDRNGRVLFIKLSIFLSIFPMIIIPFTDSFVILTILRFIQGFTLAGVPAAALAYIGEEIDMKYSGMATALYISSNPLGGMIGRVVTGYFSEINWQYAFYILSGFGLLVFLFVLVALPKSKNFMPSERTFKQDIKGFSYHLTNPTLLLMFGLGIVLQITYTGVWTYLPFHLTSKVFSLSLDAISLIYFVYGFGILGAPIAGWLSNRFTLEKVRTIAILVLIFGVAMTITQSLIILVIGMCVLCFGFFTAHALTATSVNRTAQHLKGSASSLYLVSYYIGVASGSTLIGPVWELWSWGGIIATTTVLPLIYLTFFLFISKRLSMK